MADVSEIIDISITRETLGVSRQGFGTQMFLGLHAHFPERVKLYQKSQINSLAEELGVESAEYQAVNIAFQQEPSSEFVKVGRQKVDSVDFTVDVANNATYTLTVDGVDVSIVSDADATAEEIAAALETEFTSAGAAGTFTDNLDGSFSLTPADADDFYVNYTSNINPTYNTSESITDAVDACRDFDSDWFFLTSYSHATQDILDLAAWTEAREIIYGSSYSGSDALDSQAETDPGPILKALSYSQTFLIYTENDDQYPECGIIGRQGSTDPGSSTWKFKTIVGATPSNLTPAQSFTLRGPKDNSASGKGYNTYETVGGRNIFREGMMVNGEFIDTIRLSFWIKARMEEEIFLTFVNSEKVAYTDAGATIIEGNMRNILDRGIELGGIASYTIEVPNLRALPANLRASRIAEGFKFTAVLASAIHFVGIDGRLVI